jgi:hypothetical protein
MPDFDFDFGFNLDQDYLHVDLVEDLDEDVQCQCTLPVVPVPAPAAAAGAAFCSFPSFSSFSSFVVGLRHLSDQNRPISDATKVQQRQSDDNTPWRCVESQNQNISPSSHAATAAALELLDGAFPTTEPQPFISASCRISSNRLQPSHLTRCSSSFHSHKASACNSVLASIPVTTSAFASASAPAVESNLSARIRNLPVGIINQRAEHERAFYQQHEQARQPARCTIPPSVLQAPPEAPEAPQSTNAEDGDQAQNLPAYSHRSQQFNHQQPSYRSGSVPTGALFPSAVVPAIGASAAASPVSDAAAAAAGCRSGSSPAPVSAAASASTGASTARSGTLQLPFKTLKSKLFVDSAGLSSPGLANTKTSTSSAFSLPADAHQPLDFLSLALQSTAQLLAQFPAAPASETPHPLPLGGSTMALPYTTDDGEFARMQELSRNYEPQPTVSCQRGSGTHVSQKIPF